MANFFSKMVHKLKELFSFKVHEDDARDIYPLLSKEIKMRVYLIRMASRYADPDEDYSTVGLQKENKHLWFSKMLWERTQKFIADFEKLKELKKIIWDEIKSIVNNERHERILTLFYADISPKQIEDLVRITYAVIITKNYSLEQFREVKGILSEDIVKLREDIEKNKVIQQFLSQLKTFEVESEKIQKDAMNEYKFNLQKPELTRNSLTAISIFVSIVLVVVTIWTITITSGNIELSNKLIERQLDSIAPLNPEIHFYIPNPSTYLAFQRYYLGTAEAGFYMLISNNGQFPAGSVQIRLENEQIICIPPKGGFIESLNDTQIMGVRFDCRSQICAAKGECDTSSITLGEQELNLSIECQYCNETIKERINICVYNSSQILDCGEEWGLS